MDPCHRRLEIVSGILIAIFTDTNFIGNGFEDPEKRITAILLFDLPHRVYLLKIFISLFFYDIVFITVWIVIDMRCRVEHIIDSDHIK